MKNEELKTIKEEVLRKIKEETDSPKLICRFCKKRPVSLFLFVDKKIDEKEQVFVSKEFTSCDSHSCREDLKWEGRLEYYPAKMFLLPFTAESFHNIPRTQMGKGIALLDAVFEKKFSSDISGLF